MGWGGAHSWEHEGINCNFVVPIRVLEILGNRAVLGFVIDAYNPLDETLHVEGVPRMLRIALNKH